MANIVSLIIGIFALILAIPSFIPLLGWGNWLVVPIALVGVVFGVISSSNTGRNLCLIVALVGIIRLSLGGGFI
ncbi:hypothetical protein [Sphingorhabdus sp. Alg239-R122]|uniref:hypothetical protein n=1 Tax=Sphingorhabdus sp. Alg239-R122 TaxID=2305989 RepID=UPI0013D97D10|nr:hypothetical protein [Sphingorhabdus sp. Alg239-R122]